MSEIATLGRITRRTGVAGQITLTVPVSYPGEAERVVTFSGSSYGTPGPVVMITERAQVFVTSPGRFGDVFDASWVRRFFA